MPPTCSRPLPLIVRHPDRLRVGRSAAPASGLDLVPTVLDTLGLALPLELPGLSLRKEPAADRGRAAVHAAGSHAFMRDGWKLLRGAFAGDPSGPVPERLYHLADDPGEHHDRASELAERTNRLLQLLDEHLARQELIATPQDQEVLDPALTEQLRALGYLGEG